MTAKHDRCDILLVEDNPADVYVAKRALAHSRIGARMHVASDGEEAMEFLLRAGKWHNAPRPHIVILDVNLPRKDGREVLSEIRSNQDLRRIPVAVLSSSSSEDDIISMYDLGASAYITKPDDPDTMVQVMMAIEDVWLVLGQTAPR